MSDAHSDASYDSDEPIIVDRITKPSPVSVRDSTIAQLDRQLANAIAAAAAFTALVEEEMDIVQPKKRQVSCYLQSVRTP